MELNPYESPQPSSDPQVAAGSGAFWRDTLSLLLWGAILYVPTVILVAIVVFVITNPPHPLIILLTFLILFLSVRLFWRLRNRSKQDASRDAGNLPNAGESD